MRLSPTAALLAVLVASTPLGAQGVRINLVGWPEPKVIVRFWIVALLFALVSLSTLKLR